MSSSESKTDDNGADFAELESAVEKAFAAAEKALNEGTTDQISDETVQRLLTAGSRLYANKTEMEDRFFLPILSAESATATDIVVTVTELLRAVNLNTFDLAMWFRRPRSDDAP
ncbi:MAG: hypothetical protein VX741_10915 [Pseudomonadota bacterium]|nr:hypothetical protein [Pseudomonadota bacterium]